MGASKLLMIRPLSFEISSEMKVQDLPLWMNFIPTLIGVTLAISGMYILPMYGVRNTFGPIIGLPVGTVIGVAVLAFVASRRN